MTQDDKLANKSFVIHLLQKSKAARRVVYAFLQSQPNHYKDLIVLISNIASLSGRLKKSPMKNQVFLLKLILSQEPHKFSQSNQYWRVFQAQLAQLSFSIFSFYPIYMQYALQEMQIKVP